MLGPFASAPLPSSHTGTTPNVLHGIETLVQASLKAIADRSLYMGLYYLRKGSGSRCTLGAKVDGAGDTQSASTAVELPVGTTNFLTTLHSVAQRRVKNVPRPGSARLPPLEALERPTPPPIGAASHAPLVHKKIHEGGGAAAARFAQWVAGEEPGGVVVSRRKKKKKHIAADTKRAVVVSRALTKPSKMQWADSIGGGHSSQETLDFNKEQSSLLSELAVYTEVARRRQRGDIPGHHDRQVVTREVGGGRGVHPRHTQYLEHLSVYFSPVGAARKAQHQNHPSRKHRALSSLKSSEWIC